MNIMIGADAMVKCLENEGVTTVYGYPGVAICPFYNSILDSDIQSILVRTEQNAAHAASGEARVTGKVGVCAVTSGPDTGMFYKRRDYSTIVNGKNPIVAHEFLGNDIHGKDIIIIDDMISSGDSMIDTSRQLKKMGAKRVFICTTFGLFTNGMDAFDKAYADGIFDRVITTNLCYRPPELLTKPYYLEADMSKFLASIIDFMNHDLSMENVLTPTEKIQKILTLYNEK